MKLIDMHAHIWFSKDVECEKKLILKNMEKYNVDMTFVSGLNSRFSPEEEVKTINEGVSRFAKENPNVIKGYVYICPEHKNAIDVLKKGVEEQGMIGAKIWVSEYCDSETVNPLAEKLIDYNVPLLVHAFKKSVQPQVAREATSVNVRNLALRYPELKIIMAHIDGNCYHGVQNVYGLDNVWVDVSGTTNRSNEVEYAIENLGEDKILFGTDFTGCSFSMPYGKVLEAQISDEAKEKILCKNTLRVFDTAFKVGRAFK